jgi:hypothetical protein
MLGNKSRETVIVFDNGTTDRNRHLKLAYTVYFIIKRLTIGKNRHIVRHISEK